MAAVTQPSLLDNIEEAHTVGMKFLFMRDLGGVVG